MTWSAERQQALCQKLHTRVEMPETVRLERFLAATGAQPPLPGGAAAEPGKENEQQAANPEALGSPRAAAAGGLAEAPRARQARPLGDMQPRAGGSFYGSGGSMAAASSGMLSPQGLQASTPHTFKLNRCSTPAAFKGARWGATKWGTCFGCLDALQNPSPSRCLQAASQLPCLKYDTGHTFVPYWFAVPWEITRTRSCSKRWRSACWSSSPASSRRSSRVQRLARWGSRHSSKSRSRQRQ